MVFTMPSIIGAALLQRTLDRLFHSQPPTALCHYLLSRSNWYRALFADCFGTLGTIHFQDSVVEELCSCHPMSAIGTKQTCSMR